MISTYPLTIQGILASLVVAISFLVAGIIWLAFPRRVQKSDMRRYEKLPSFLKFFRSPDYIESRRFIWVTRAWGLLSFAVGIGMILVDLWWLFGPKS